MPLTGSFCETVQARARRDVKFRQAMLVEAMQALLGGDLAEGYSALRSCINATVGFEKLGAALGRSPKSLMGCSARRAIPAPEICSASSACCRRRCAFACKCGRRPARINGRHGANSKISVFPKFPLTPPPTHQ
jgi:hypothetical protein